MRTLSAQTKLQVPLNTRITSCDGDVVITGVHGAKTLSGDHASVCDALVRACDGRTPLSEVTDYPDDVTRAVAKALYEQGILYPTELLEPLNLDERFRGLFESIMLCLEPAARESFAEDVKASNIEIHGDEYLAEQLQTALQALDWTVVSGDTLEEPDVITFVEKPTTSVSTRTAVNEKWCASESILVRLGLNGEQLSVGPLLSPSAQVCLDCLTTREQMNDAQAEFGYEMINPGPSPTSWIFEPIAIQMTAYAATSMIPPSLEGIITTLGFPALEYRESRLLGVPGCDSCGR